MADLQDDGINRRGQALTLFLAVSVIALLVIQANFVPRQSSGSRLMQAPTDTPVPTQTLVPDPFSNDSPILTAADAIARSEARLPASASPTGQFARLMSMQTLMDNTEWLFGSDWNFTTPVWLVGMYTANLVNSDVVGESAAGSTPAPIDGAVFVWDANGGLLIVEGSIHSPTSPNPIRTYAGLFALPNQSIPIVAATPVPTGVFGTGPEPTSLPPWTPTP